MKKHKINTLKLFFLFATIGAFPYLYPAIQFQAPSGSLISNANFKPLSIDSKIVFSESSAKVMDLAPIDPALGSEIQPDPVE